MKNSARTIALSVAKLLISINSKLVNFLNCGNVLKLQSGDRKNTSKYRPISILPKLSKILKKAVHPQL